MLQRALTTLVAGVVLAGLTNSAAWAQQDIRWGTPPVGTAGHKALVTLANLLNNEMPKYRISVLPMAGAIATVKGFATEELDGNYGSDVAFHELATDSNRFKGFKQRVQRWPVQSFWSNTIEVGLAVHVRNKDKIKKWGDLAGKRVFTGPLPFDTRAQTERGFNVSLDIPEADVYQMLNIVEKHAAELAQTDPTFSQIAKDMKGFQKRGVESSVDLVAIHPGLAKWMREKAVWDPKWDSRIAKP